MNITNDKVTDFINSYYQPLNESLAALRVRCEENYIPLILPETEMFFRTFLRILKPAAILEIGTAYGYSALCFSEILPEADIVSIELNEENAAIAREEIRKAGREDRITVLEGEASSVLDRMAGEGGWPAFDLIFIDAAKSHYREFFDKALLLSGRGAVIICDNILMRAYLVDSSLDPKRRHRTSIKRMQDFLRYLNDRKDLSVSLLSEGDGLAIIKLYE